MRRELEKERSRRREGRRGGEEGGGRRSTCERDLERRTESQETEKRRDVECQAPPPAPGLRAVVVAVVWGSG